MRVTDLTKHDSVLRAVNNNSERMQTLQENMASGKRINSLSDDPIGATQVQDMRTRISFFDMIKRTIQDNYILLDRYETELAGVGELLQDAKNLMLAQANGNADDATRAVTAQELEAITESLIKSGNSKVGKLYIFSGTKTLTQPLVKNLDNQPAIINDQNVDTSIDQPIGPENLSGLFYDSADRELFDAEYIGHSSNEYIVRITKPGPFGRARYKVSDDGGESWSRQRPLLRDNPVVNPDGKPDDRIVLKFRSREGAIPEMPVIFPVGLEYHFVPNPPISYHGNRVNKQVPVGEGATTPINLTAHQVFFTHERDPESLDVFDLLFTLHRALIENEPRVLQARLDDLDQAYRQVLNRRADMGATRKELELQFEKMLNREYTKTKQLSDVEDLDFQEAVVEMNLAELRNQASLDTGARLLQPSLLDFLR